MMPNRSNKRLNTTDHTQSARNCQASANSRRISFLVEYCSVVVFIPDASVFFRPSKCPKQNLQSNQKNYEPWKDSRNDGHHVAFCKKFPRIKTGQITSSDCRELLPLRPLPRTGRDGTNIRSFRVFWCAMVVG